MLNPASEGVEFILSECSSLASLHQQALANDNPFFTPKSQAMRYLTGLELRYPGLDLVSFRRFFGTLFLGIAVV